MKKVKKKQDGVKQDNLQHFLNALLCILVILSMMYYMILIYNFLHLPYVSVVYSCDYYTYQEKYAKDYTLEGYTRPIMEQNQGGDVEQCREDCIIGDEIMGADIVIVSDDKDNSVLKHENIHKVQMLNGRFYDCRNWMYRYLNEIEAYFGENLSDLIYNEIYGVPTNS